MFFSSVRYAVSIAPTTTHLVALSHHNAIMLDEDAFNAYAPEADEVTTSCVHLKNAVKTSLPKELKKALTKGDDDVGICKVSALFARLHPYSTSKRLVVCQSLRNAPMPATSQAALTICGYVCFAARQAVVVTLWDMPRLVLFSLTLLKESFFLQAHHEQRGQEHSIALHLFRNYTWCYLCDKFVAGDNGKRLDECVKQLHPFVSAVRTYYRQRVDPEKKPSLASLDASMKSERMSTDDKNGAEKKSVEQQNGSAVNGLVRETRQQAARRSEERFSANYVVKVY